MAKIALNITEGYVGGAAGVSHAGGGSKAAGEGTTGATEIWAVAAVHACLNHTCLSRATLLADTPNVYPHFMRGAGSKEREPGLVHKHVDEVWQTPIRPAVVTRTATRHRR